MKSNLLAAMIAFVTPHAQAEQAAPLAVDTLLDAIAAVESGNDPRAVGPRGERGRCQFRAATWREYTNAEFLAWAPVDCALTRGIERAHLARLCRGLTARGYSLDPALLAAAWRFGLEHALQTGWRSDYARRVANLYYDAQATKGRAAR